MADDVRVGELVFPEGKGPETALVEVTRAMVPEGYFQEKLAAVQGEIEEIHAKWRVASSMEQSAIFEEQIIDARGKAAYWVFVAGLARDVVEAQKSIVLFTELMRDAERVLNQHTMRAKPGRPRKDGSDGPPGNGYDRNHFSESVRKKMSMAHRGLTDEQYQEAKVEARLDNRPLTHEAMIAKAKALKAAETEPPEKEKGGKVHLAAANPATRHDEWYTPGTLMEAVRRFYGQLQHGNEGVGYIDLDPASCEAANEIVKARNFCTVTDNGLAQRWEGYVWLNPPYSKKAEWIAKASQEARHADAILMLLNASTETMWAQRAMRGAHRICFLGKRVRFYGPSVKDESKAAPMVGQMLLFHGGGNKPLHFERFWRDHGVVVWPRAVL